MKDFDPMKSFGDDTAASYDDSLRGDEAETVSCLESLPAAARYWNWPSAPGASACRWPPADSGWMASSSRPR